MTEAVTRLGAGQSSNGRQSGSVRQFISGDIPTVASMFAKTFAAKGKKPGAELANYLDRLFIAPLQREPEIASLVHLDAEGRVNGFIGVVAIPYRIDGERRTAALCSTMMVDDRDADPFAGARARSAGSIPA